MHHTSSSHFFAHFFAAGGHRTNSTSGKFANIWQSKRVGIIAIKIERTQIPLLSDVVTTVAAVVSGIPVTVLDASVVASLKSLIPFTTGVTIFFQRRIGMEFSCVNYRKIALNFYHDRICCDTDYLNNVLDGTLTVTLIPTLRPTLALLRKRLYRTSEAPLKLLHVYYTLTIYALHTNRWPLYGDCLLMSWAWGGVFTFHGYKNEVLFRKFKIALQTYITKRCKKVVRNIYDTKAVLDASQWYNKRLVSSTTLCYKDSKTTWREVCKFIKEESRFLEPSVFWNFALIWTKLNLQNTSLHQSKPEISPADFSNLQIVRTNFLFPRWFEK